MRILGTTYRANCKPRITATARSCATSKDKDRTFPRQRITEKVGSVKMANNAISYYKTAQTVFRYVSLLPALVKSVAAGVVLVAAIRVIFICKSRIDDIRVFFFDTQNGINKKFDSVGAGCKEIYVRVVLVAGIRVKSINDSVGAASKGMYQTIETTRTGIYGKVNALSDVLVGMYEKVTSISIRDKLPYPFKDRKDIGAIEDVGKVGYLADVRKKFNDKLAFLGKGNKDGKDAVEQKPESDQNAVITDSYSEKLKSLLNKYLPVNVPDKEEKKEDNLNAVMTDSCSEKLKSSLNKYLPANISDDEKTEEKEDEK